MTRRPQKKNQVPPRTTRPSPFTTPAIRMLETRLELSTPRRPGPLVRCALDVSSLLRELIGDADREHFIALYLNSRHSVTHVHVVSRGTSQSAPVHPREVFKGAYLANAAALVIAHNHPSGDVRPSTDDRAVTERLKQAGELLGIAVLDAVIVGPGPEFYSAAEDRILTDTSPCSREVADGS